MSKINWEQKYKTLKKTFLSTIDTAFRAGFEQGYNQAQREMQNQQIVGAMQQVRALGGEQTGNGDQAAMQQALEQQMPQEMEQQGSNSQQELTQKVGELEQLLGKAEDIYSKKAEKSMLNLSGMFNKNLTHLQKQNIVGQEKMVREILDKWKRQKKELEGDYDKAINTGKIKLE